MRVLYIGLYNEGSTSRMRGEYLKELIPNASFSLIDTSEVLSNTHKFIRSIGWRWKIGPLINNVNAFILENLNQSFYDLVWVDKGVFVSASTTSHLKKISGKLVHFTPDPAFAYHRSNLFFASLPFYDYCITTKQFEIEEYKKHGVKTILCTQGYDRSLHKPYHTFSEKKGVVFIGHREEEREEILSNLIEAGIHVTVAGIKWNELSKRYKYKSNFKYKGTELLGEAYAREISSAQIGLGLLSKWIPETHTTRTFEIPACRTALVTEKNYETASFFNDDEVLFYKNKNEIIELVKSQLSDPELLHATIHNGYERVRKSNTDYRSIMSNLLNQMGVI